MVLCLEGEVRVEGGLLWCCTWGMEGGLLWCCTWREKRVGDKSVMVVYVKGGGGRWSAVVVQYVGDGRRGGGGNCGERSGMEGGLLWCCTWGMEGGLLWCCTWGMEGGLLWCCTWGMEGGLLWCCTWREKRVGDKSVMVVYVKGSGGRWSAVVVQYVGDGRRGGGWKLWREKWDGGRTVVVLYVGEVGIEGVLM